MKNDKDTLYLAKHDDFILGKYNFNLDSLKLLNIIALKAQAPFFKPISVEVNGIVESYVYKFDFNKLKEDSGINAKIDTHSKDWSRLFKDLTSKVVIFNDDKQIKGVGLFQKFIIHKESKTLELMIDKDIKKYLFDEIAYRQLNKYSTNYMYLCSSKYSFRLYEILINKIKKVQDKDIIFDVFLNIEELKNLLSIPKSYPFGKINQSILKKAEEDFNGLVYSEDKNKQNEHRLFKSFEYEPIKDVTHKRGNKPIKSVKFTFELLQNTIFTMMSDNQIKEIEETKEDYLYNSLEYNIKVYGTDKPFINTRSVADIFEEITQIIEDVKDELTINSISPSILRKTIEFTFRKIKTYNNFYFFFKDSVIKNIEFSKKNKKRSL